MKFKCDFLALFVAVALTAMFVTPTWSKGYSAGSTSSYRSTPTFTQRPSTPAVAPRSYSAGPAARTPVQPSTPSRYSAGSTPVTAGRPVSIPPSTVKPATTASRPASVPIARPAAPPAAKSGFVGGLGNRFTHQQSAGTYNKFKEEQAKRYGPAPKPNPAPVKNPQSNPTYVVIQRRVDSGWSSNDYWRRRDDFYRRYNYAPSYSSPNYGMYAATFLGGYLLGDALSSNSQAAQFMYHHADDPGVQAWLKETTERAASDADLKARLDSLNRQVEALKTQGLPKDPAFVPKDVEPDLMVSPEVVASIKPKVRVCVGALSGNYAFAANVWKTHLESVMDITIVPTAGSLEELDKITRNECDVAIVQRDAFLVYAKKHEDATFPFERISDPQEGFYQEYAHLLCSRSSNVARVEDLGMSNKVLIDKDGSGTRVTWDNLVASSPRYAAVKTGDEGKNDALTKVLNGQASCMMYVAAPGSDFLKRADTFGEKIKLVPMQDESVLGLMDPAESPVYSFVEFDGKYYPNLQDRGWLNWGGTVGTYAVAADIIVSNDWKGKNGDLYDNFAGALLETRDTVLEHVAQK